jgi:hypothetical protein
MLLPMIGILAAPFIGFLLSPDLALGLLVICLGTTGWMTMSISQQAPPKEARTLRMGAIMNYAMAVAAMLLLIIRL